MTFKLRIPVTILVGFLSAELVILPIRKAAADDTVTAIDGPVEAGFTEQGPTFQTPSKPAKPAKLLEDVANTGALQTSYKIEVPPGRNGATPSLTLQYSSEGAQHASAFGAGWSLPVSSVSRSVRHGTPRITHNADGTNRRYNDDPAAEIFERDGVELAADVTAPAQADAVNFRDHLDHTRARSVFYPAPPSYWIVTQKDGFRSFYGRVPNDSSVPTAVLSDDLGVSRWLLVRTIDNFGNAIDYEYVHPSQDPVEPVPAPGLQLEALLLDVKYGKNVTMGYDHYAAVLFHYQQTEVQSFSYISHTYLNRILSGIETGSLAVANESFRTYSVSIEKSPSSPRYLLKKISEISGGLSGPVTSFEYSRNDGVAGELCAPPQCPIKTTALAPSAGISASIERNVFRNHFQAGLARTALHIPLDDLFAIPDPDGRPRWPFQYMLQTEDRRFLSAAGAPGGFTFRDLDGDGGMDILYLPNFVSGWGLPQPWVTYLRNGTDASGNPTYENYYSGQRAAAYDAGLDPLSLTEGASDFVDVDKDGVLDRVALVPMQSTDVNGSVGIEPLMPQVGRPEFDYSNPDCVKWLKGGGPRVQPIPLAALPASLRNLGDITSLISGTPAAGATRFARQAAQTANSCSVVTPPELAYSIVAADLAPFNPPATPSFDTQPVEVLAHQPRSLDILAFPISFQPLPPFGPPALQPIICNPRGPIGPLTPRQIDTSAMVITPGGQLGVDTGKLATAFDAQMQQFGLTFPVTGEGPRIIAGIPGTSPEPCPLTPITPITPPKIERPKICIGTLCIDPTPGAPPLPSTPFDPTPFNIGEFDPSVCFKHDFDVPNPERRIPLLQITRSALRGGPRTSTSYYLGNFPFNEGPTYYVDYQNPAIPGIPLPQRISAIRPGNNVYMPFVDLDRDGVPEAVALKAIHTHKDKLFADLAMSARVWRIADYSPVPEGSYNPIQDTQFEESLKTILRTSRPALRFNPSTISFSPDLTCEKNGSGAPSLFDVDSQRLLSIADWVTTFLDVNADGLPDLVMAKGATCYHSSNTAVTDHQAGFDVFLNRGDRFETTPQTGELSHGPFDMVRNWTSGHLESDMVPSADTNRFPFVGLSFADLDADGVQDAILSLRVGWDAALDESEGPAKWPTDSSACADDLGTKHNSGQLQPFVGDPGTPNVPSFRIALNSSMVRCVWRGTGTKWVGAKDLAAKLPSNSTNGMHAFAAWVQDHAGSGRFTETYTMADLSRFADLNGDGIADLMTIGQSSGDPMPDQDPNRALVNTSQRSDLLQAIDNGIGSRIRIQYRPAKLSELTQVASIPWVVDTISKETKVGATSSLGEADGAEPTDQTTLTYEGGKYDFFDQAFLGFAAINGSRPAFTDEGISVGTQVVRNVFYQDEQSSGTTARNPLKGLLKGSVLRDAAGTLDVMQTSASYEVVKPDSGNVWRVRQIGAVEDSCASLACPSSAAHIARTTTWSDFDEFDNPKSEVAAAVRSNVGDQLDGTITVTEARTYQNDTSNWIIGLVSTYKRSYATPAGDVTLASESYTYRADKLQSKTVVRIGTEPSCEEIPGDYVETNSYNGDGTLSETGDNNNVLVGASARTYQTFAYDSTTHSLPIEIHQHHTAGNQIKDLTTTHVYDYRFGLAKSTTDPNGNTTQTIYDGLGRITDEVSAEGTTFRQHIYDLTNRPIIETAYTYPGSGIPQIVETRYLDGKRRVLQSTIDDPDAGKTIVTGWKRYDTLGEASRSAVPFEIETKDFVVSGANGPTAIYKSRSDVLGRPAQYQLPDGRTASVTHSVGILTGYDFRGTPHWTHLDAVGHAVRSEEALRKHDVTGPFTPGTYTTVSTSATRDGDGRVSTVTDPENRTRSFRYDHNGKVTSAGTATGEYLYCYDGHGGETRRESPDGRIVKNQYDDLGRIMSKTHLPAATYGSADLTYQYDDSQVANATGMLTAIRSTAADLEVGAYDVRGNVTMRTHVSHLGALASPWADGRFVSTAAFDRVNRATSEYLPIDATQMNADATILVEYGYDSRGQLRKLRQNNRDVVNVVELLPSGKIKNVKYGDGSNDVWTFEPLNERTSTVTTTLASQSLLAYDYQYDENSNPRHVGRTMSDGGTSRTLTKTQLFDTLERLESSTYSGAAGINHQYDFTYTNSGNVLSKDGLTYKYEGSEPQAVSSRVSNSGSNTEVYGYDLDGQLTSASPDHDGRSLTLTWNGDGRLATMAADAGASGSTTMAFSYGPEGSRVAKRVTIVGSAGGPVSKSYSDISIGALELRGSDASDGLATSAYYNLDLGKVHAQLALRRDANGKLSRDASADRYYHVDNLGSTALVTAGDGQTVSSEAAHGQLEYAPYGEAVLSDAGTAHVKRRFTGKEQDELGLTYFGARYVDSKLGRWVSRDPRALQTAGTGLIGSQHANLYAFADNNPSRNVDADGQETDVMIAAQEFAQAADHAIGKYAVPVIIIAAIVYYTAKALESSTSAPKPTTASPTPVTPAAPTAPSGPQAPAAPAGPPATTAPPLIPAVPGRKADEDPDVGRLPGLDGTGRLHDDKDDRLPGLKDLDKFSTDDLVQFAQDLKKSVQERIRDALSKNGPDQKHGERIAKEQELAKRAEKIIRDRTPTPPPTPKKPKSSNNSGSSE